MEAVHALECRSTRYRAALAEVAAFLREVGEVSWVWRIDRWLNDLDVIERAGDQGACCRHIHRSWFFTLGMGSLGDLTIGPHNGHAAVDLAEANRRWRALVGVQPTRQGPRG